VAIVDAQIVNGLQSSLVIYNYFHDNPERLSLATAKRKLLVRIIKSKDLEVQDHVIEATNSQTGIKAASFRALDKIQRDIEKIFVDAGLYYDRRKNYWRNRKMPLNQIVSMTELAQAVASLHLQQPDVARGRPSKYFNDDSLYGQIFSENFNINVYTQCALLKKRVEEYLRSSNMERRDRTNLIFHVLMMVGVLATGKPKPSIQDLVKLKDVPIADATIADAISKTDAIYRDLGANDKVAKGKEFIIKLEESLAGL
jgi:AIPR protein